MAVAGERVGEYLLEAELARGGMGAVYRGRHLPSGRPVALKLLLRLEPAQRARLAREAGALTRIHHPHLVRMLDAGEDAGRPFLVLELIEGATLAERLEQRGRFSPAESLALVRPLVGALEALHAAGLVHRDVKPENVLLGADGVPRLADLGLVKDLDPEASRLSRSGAFMGTPGYWAPEQALGEGARIGPHTDIHGLGAVLYACLTGQPPWSTRDLASAVQEALDGKPPPPPSTLAPGIPPALDAVVLRCLAARPEGRYPTASALGAALDGLGPLAVPRGLPRDRVTGAARAALALAVLGVLAAGFVVFTSQRGMPGPAAPAPGGQAAGAASGSQEVTRAAPSGQGEAALASARARADAGDLPGALEELDRLLARRPDDPAALTERGILRLAAGDGRGALADFDRVVALAPEEATVRANRGAARLDLGDLDGADEDLRRVLDHDPGDGPALLARARLWSLRGDPAQEAADLEAFLERWSDAPAAAGARAQLDGLRSPRPGDASPAALSDRGVAREKRGDVEGALADYTRALTLDPRLGAGWINRAALLGRRRELRLALADAERGVEVMAGEPSAWLNLALARQSLGDTRGALQAYERTLELDPGNLPALYNRGLAWDDLGETARARADWERVIALEPNGDAARLARGALAAPPGRAR